MLPSGRGGVVLMTDNGRVEAGDYWLDDSGSIIFLEAKVLLCALDAFKSRIRDSRVDVLTDSRALLGSWQSEGGSNTEINDVIKAVLRCSQEFNFSIDMHSDSNSRRDLYGNCLPHFTPCHTPESSGIIVFAQQLPVGENLYVFPPFVLIGPLLRFCIDQHYQHPFTIIVLDIQPRRYWWDGYCKPRELIDFSWGERATT